MTSKPADRVSGHTPGPWHLGKGRVFVRHTTTLDGHLIAPNICDLSVFGGPEEEREANARLITAAPELLDAATNLLLELAERNDHDCYDEVMSEPCPIGLRVAAAVEKLEAAIAKAEGRG